MDVPILTKGSPKFVQITIKPEENVQVDLTLDVRGFTPYPRMPSTKQPLGIPPAVAFQFSSATTNRGFPVFPNEAGRYSLHFTISVSSRETITSIYPETLEYLVLVIDPSVHDNYFNALNHYNRSLVPSVFCNQSLEANFCPDSERADVILASSCGWNESDTSTGGIVFAYSSASEIFFPISAIGLKVTGGMNDLSLIMTEDILCSTCSSNQNFTATLPTNYELGSAYPYMYVPSLADSSEFILRDSLAFTFLHTVQQSLLPSWLMISIPILDLTQVTFLDSDLINEVSSRDSIEKMEECQLQTIADEGRYVVLKHDGEVKFTAENRGENDSATLSGNAQSPGYLHCFAVSLCDSHPAVHVGLPDKASQSFIATSFFETLRANGWQFDIHSFSFKKNTQGLSSTKNHWNGVRENYSLPLFQPDVTMRGSAAGLLTNHDTMVKVEVDGFIEYEYNIKSEEVRKFVRCVMFLPYIDCAVKLSIYALYLMRHIVFVTLFIH